MRGLPPEKTAKLLDTAHGIAQAFLRGAELIDEIQRGDWTPAEYGRRRHEAVVKAREPLEEAVRQRQQAGGEIPERLQPLLQGKPRPSVKLPGGSVPDVLGRVGDIAAATLRGLGFKVVQVMGTGSPGMVADQDPRAGQWLTAGCRVTLKVAPGKARPRGPTQIP